jgi:hypothetical protein
MPCYSKPVGQNKHSTMIGSHRGSVRDTLLIKPADGSVTREGAS